MNRLAIVATPRSGTLYTTDLLRSVGLDFKHENLGEHGGCGWALLLPDRDISDCVVFHQVRHPLHTIASLHTVNPGLFTEAEKHVGALPEKQPDRAAEFWVRWNLRCEVVAEYRYRVELLWTSHGPLSKIAGKEGFNFTDEQWRLLQYPPTNHNSKPHLTLTWVQLAHIPAVRETGERYGYE